RRDLIRDLLQCGLSARQQRHPPAGACYRPGCGCTDSEGCTGDQDGPSVKLHRWLLQKSTPTFPNDLGMLYYITLKESREQKIPRPYHDLESYFAYNRKGLEK